MFAEILKTILAPGSLHGTAAPGGVNNKVNDEAERKLNPPTSPIPPPPHYPTVKLVRAFSTPTAAGCRDRYDIMSSLAFGSSFPEEGTCNDPTCGVLVSGGGRLWRLTNVRIDRSERVASVAFVSGRRKRWGEGGGEHWPAGHSVVPAPPRPHPYPNYHPYPQPHPHSHITH
ncbi:hypothetical protein Pcinc_009416 [Petrolisthes cinctipes]|uniref:Uncharacterized protein n=1 Tax=Petrolisthes cinctipes TaxID=88211 RepID=A0AAE1G7G6_PETCI|nr:hypothetical protein Pcinc_009416 [Petrolisthes cinctipes]